MNTKNIEGVGEKFDLEAYLAARSSLQLLCERLHQAAKVGMNSEDFENLYKELGPQFGIEKNWHPLKVRIGTDTVKAFREKSDPNIRIVQNDIYFFDMGPIIGQHEADFGRTYVMGSSETLERLRLASEELFNEGKSQWASGMSGEALYDYLKEAALKRELVLDTGMQGHRLGDFPHHIHFRGSLSENQKVPLENLWVLEIHLIDPLNNVGAFFEDLLMK